MVGCSGGTGTDRERKGRKFSRRDIYIYIYRVESNAQQLYRNWIELNQFGLKGERTLETIDRLASPRLEMLKSDFQRETSGHHFRSFEKNSVAFATIRSRIKRYSFAREYFYEKRYFSPLFIPSPLPSCYLAAYIYVQSYCSTLYQRGGGEGETHSYGIIPLSSPSISLFQRRILYSSIYIYFFGGNIFIYTRYYVAILKVSGSFSTKVRKLRAFTNFVATRNS